MASHDTVTWSTGTILFGGNEQHQILAGATSDAAPVGVGGAMTSSPNTRYIIFWDRKKPTIFQTVLESAYADHPDKIVVMELTTGDVGEDVQIQAREITHSASDKLNATSFNKIVAGTFSTGPMTGIVNPTYREGGVVLDANGLFMWSDTALTSTTPQVSLRETTGLSFMADDNTGFLLSRYTSSALTFYDKTSQTATATSKLSEFNGSGLSFYDNSAQANLNSRFTGTGLTFYNGAATNYKLADFTKTALTFYDGTTNNLLIAKFSAIGVEYYDISGSNVRLSKFDSNGATFYNNGGTQLARISSGGVDIFAGTSATAYLNFRTGAGTTVKGRMYTDGTDVFLMGHLAADVVLHSTSGNVRPLGTSTDFGEASANYWANIYGANVHINAINELNSGYITVNDNIRFLGTLAFDPDTDTGISNPSDDHLSLTAGGGSVAVNEAVSGGVSYMGIYPANGGDGTWSNGSSTAPWTNLGAYATTSGWYSQGFNAIIGYYMRAGDGAPTYPTMSFYNDSTTGFYRIASGRVGFSGGGTKHVEFGAGNLGGHSSSFFNIGHSEFDGAIYYDGYATGSTVHTVSMNATTNQFLRNSSSLRYKKDIKDIGELIPSETIWDLQPKAFKWKEDTGTPNEQDAGLIAEEVHEIDPNLTVLNEAGQVEAVRYSYIPLLLLEEMKKLRTRIKQLEEKN